MALTKRLSGYRYVQIRQGETLQALALRELGDADLWRELIAINDLAPPYLTGDAMLAFENPRVRLYGQSIVVPASATDAPSVVDLERVFGADIKLTKGRLTADASGDLEIVAGVANLKQALEHRIDTPLGGLQRHPSYGCGIHSLKGQGGRPGTATLAAQYTRAALLADPRIRSVEAPKATVKADAIAVSATAKPISGSAVDIESQV